MTNIRKNHYKNNTYSNDLFMVEHFQLKNNLNLLLIPRPDSVACMVGFVTPTGLVMEENAFPKGINFLLERLLWSGTTKYPSNRQLNIYLESLACQVHTEIGYDKFSLFLEVPAYNQFKALSLLANLFQEPLFESNSIDNHKKQLREILFSGNREENVGQSGQAFILRNFYLNKIDDVSGYGSLEAFMDIRKDDLLDYTNHQIHPDKSYLVVCGNFDKTEILELADQEWGYWTPKNRRYIDPVELKDWTTQTLPNIKYRQIGSYMTEVSLGFLLDGDPAGNFKDEESGEWLPEKYLEALKPDYVRRLCTLMLLNNILGEGISSKLWTKCVEEEMVFSNISSRIKFFKNAVYIEVFGLVDNNLFSFGIESVLKVVESLRKATISINELTRCKENTKGRYLLQTQDLLNYAGSITDSYMNTRLTVDTDEIITAMDYIQASEVRNLALDLFVPEKTSLFIAGTAKETKVVEKLVYKYLQ